MHAPWLDLFQTFYVLDSLRYIPHLISIDHQDTSSRTRVLADELWAIGIPVLGDEFGVIDDAANDLAPSKVGGGISTNFHFEMVKALSESFFGKPSDFLVAVALKKHRKSGLGILIMDLELRLHT